MAESLGGGGTLPYLKFVGNFCISYFPLTCTYSFVPLFYTQLDLRPRESTEKSVCLSYLVLEIIWSNVCLIFHQICHLPVLHSFLLIFVLIFDLAGIFHPYFYKHFMNAGLPYENWGEMPTPGSITFPHITTFTYS